MTSGQDFTRGGVRSFVVICFGQSVSLIGSRLTNFTLGVWAYQTSGSITQFGLIVLCYVLPNTIILPFAGVLVDRFDRRKIMIFSNLASSLVLLLIVILFYKEGFALWHLCIFSAALSMLSAFHLLASSAAITMLVPKRHYSRAIGATQFGEAAAQVLAPMLAGVLVATIPVYKISLIDLGSFLFCAALQSMVQIPNPEMTTRTETGENSFRKQFTYGWSFIAARRGLLGFLIFCAAVNFSTATLQVLITPVVLTIASTVVLGAVLSAGAIGTLVGSIFISLWGGPKTRVYGTLGFSLIQGIALIIAGAYLSPIILGSAVAIVFFCFPGCNNCNQVIWQSKVPANVQGRVFSVRRMIGTITLPIAVGVAGPLTDQVFNPLMDTNGPLSSTVGRVLGAGPNQGISLFLVLLGSAVVIEVIASYLYSPLRNLERDLPDAIITA